jgi:hypothetical protein
MTSKVKKGLQTVAHYAKIAWEVPAVKSAALTWLIRLGVPGAAILIPVFDALVNK